MPTSRVFPGIAGRVAAFLAPLLLASCWLVSWDSDDEADRCPDRTTNTCPDLGETTCTEFGRLGIVEGGCSFTYYDCAEMCQGGGWVRSAGCDWDSRAGEHRCMCTNDETCECGGDDASCWDSNTLLSCGDGCYWTGHDCDEVCRSHGYDVSAGCDYDAETGGDTCFCTNEPDCECTADDYVCGDSYTLWACSDGCSWYEYDCDTECRSIGYDGAVGCGYDPAYGGDACLCESSSSSPSCECGWGEAACWDNATLASCDGCSWYLYDCDEVCQSYGYEYSTGCEYDWAASADNCFCGSW